MGISQMKIFFENHTIGILNRSFHPRLVSEVCEILYKFILTASHRIALIYYLHDYQLTENVC